VQRSDLEDRHLRVGFTLSVLFGVAAAAVVIIVAPLVADFFRMDGLAPIIRVMSLLFLLQGPAIVAESLLQRELHFRWLAIIDVVTFAIGYGVVGILLAFLGLGVWALVLAQLVQVLLKTASLLVVRPHPKSPSLERGAVEDLLYFGGGFTAARIGNYLAVQGDNLVVGRMLGAEALGIYGRAYQLMAAPAMAFGQILDKVLFPAMAKVQHDAARLAAAYRTGVALIALVILPITGVVFLLAPEVVRVVLGERWMAVVEPLQIFTLGMLFRTSYKMSDTLARATGAIYRRAWRQIIYAVLVIGGAWIGAGGGVRGVALGVLGALGVNFLLMAHLSLKLASLSWRSFGMAHAPSLALAAVLTAGVWALRTVLKGHGVPPLALLITAGVLVLGGIVLLLKYLPRFFLGQEGLWMLRKLVEYLPARARPTPRAAEDLP
jgi:PST family polysaccharide transporter